METQVEKHPWQMSCGVKRSYRVHSHKRLASWQKKIAQVLRWKKCLLPPAFLGQYLWCFGEDARSATHPRADLQERWSQDKICCPYKEEKEELFPSPFQYISQWWSWSLPRSHCCLENLLSLSGLACSLRLFVHVLISICLMDWVFSSTTGIGKWCLSEVCQGLV